MVRLAAAKAAPAAVDATAGQNAPSAADRVTLSDIEAAIAVRYDVRGSEAIVGSRIAAAIGKTPEELLFDELPAHGSLRNLSICILVMRNGFAVVGMNKPVSPANFDAELGRDLAYQDCIRQLWPLMGFSLRDRLAAR